MGVDAETGLPDRSSSSVEHTIFVIQGIGLGLLDKNSSSYTLIPHYI